MTILAVILLIGVLVLLISWARVPPFLAFLITALLAALSFRMPPGDIVKSIEHGIGDMLGSLTGIICLGAMFGRVIADSGAAQQIAGTLVDAVGPRLILIAMALTGLIVGIPLFYSVGFVLMIPLVFSLARQAKLPAAYLGIPLLCGLSVAHGFLPPHPSPVALIRLFAARTDLTLAYGLVIAGAALLVAGPLLARMLKPFAMRADRGRAGSYCTVDDVAERDLPSRFASFSIALLPVLLIGAAMVAPMLLHVSPPTESALVFIGQPLVVLTIALASAVLVLGLARGMKPTELMDNCGHALKEVCSILLILAGAGALKQIFVDSGVSAQVGNWLQSLPLHPLMLGWLIAMVIRIALGSATIAGLTTAGLLAPIVAAGGVDPNLMVLSVGAGSLMCSHVNDPGFWMFKEYFGLSLKDTLRSWTVMESLVGVTGLLGVLLLNLLVHGR